jgi:CRISPR-associated protein Cas5d
MFDCVAYWKTAYIRPTRVEICNPIEFQRYATNYGGPLRKGNQIAIGASYQLFATILIDVCYKVHGVVTEHAAAPDATNHLHALQEMFERRLHKGRLYRTPCLGWSEFAPSYFGPLRESTHRCENVDGITIPSMLRRVFSSGSMGHHAPKFDQNVSIVKGVLTFVE